MTFQTSSSIDACVSALILACSQHREITRLNGIYKRMLAGAGVTSYEGEGKVVDPHKVQVTDPAGETKYYTAKHILIATGARAVTLNIPGRVSCCNFFPRYRMICGLIGHLLSYMQGLTAPNQLYQEYGITSDEALSLEEFPKRIVIIGGG